MVKKDYTTISVKIKDRDFFSKLNSDWNVLHPTQRKTREEFFVMMLNKFKEQLKEENKK